MTATLEKPKKSIAGVWNSAVTSYYLLAGATLLLVGIGLVMVLSSSSVKSLQATGGRTPFSIASDQGLYAVLGVAIAIIASRLPVKFYKIIATPALAVGMGLQVLVFTSFGSAVGGNLNWISIGGFRMQPSEVIKAGLAMWLGLTLARKRHLLGRWLHVIWPAGIVAGAAVGLVLMGHDLGTALVLFMLIAGALLVAGIPMRMFAAASGIVLIGVVYLAQSSNSRIARITAFFSPECDPLKECYQTNHGLAALATGGLFGVGLGESRQKWLYLPAAHNDFIFAIIGEELGLIGTVGVLALFAILAVAMARLIRRSVDPFVQITTAAVATWVIGQALINIFVVVGLLPVIGVPLPLVSYGGTALIVTLAAMGMLMAFARREPGAAAALAARGTVVRKSLAVLATRRPEPLMPTALLAGGGTAGHVNPLLVVAEILRGRGWDVHALGTESGLESRLVPAAGFPLHTIARSPLPRTLSLDVLRFPAGLVRALTGTRRTMGEVAPDVVVGFGGYVSTPAYLTAGRRPIVIHEQNARAGLANRLGARFTRHVAATFAATKLRGAVRTGLPLRAPIVDLARAPDRAERRAAARAELGLATDAPTLLVTGGSLGAQRLNETVTAAAPELLAGGSQILHLTGGGKAVEPAGEGHHVREYLGQMELAYAAADLVVCRAGAGTVCELAALALPAVYVPLPIGNGEQRLNATPTVSAGGGLLVDNDAFTPAWFAQNVPALLGDAGRLAAMGAAAATQGIVDAGERVADMVEATA